jgi:tetratricopeptide (TPR) repeat protein
MAMIQSIAAFLLPLLLGQASAAEQAEQARTAACIAKIDVDADEAYEDAMKWLAIGGRPGARQCAALALIAKGQEEEGAARLEELANAKDAGGIEPRIIYLAQAGNAWLLAGAPEAAIVTLSNAIKLSPRDGQLRVDRARAHMTMKAWTEAGQDLDSAIELSPGDAEALHMRAQVLIKEGRLQDAWTDIERARKQDPKDISIIVTRGQIREAMRAKEMPDPDGLDAPPETRAKVVGN